MYFIVIERRPTSIMVNTEILSESQSNVFQIVKKAIASFKNPSENGNVFFVRGAAGTGKTFLLNHIKAHCENKDIRAIAFAYTGIASCLLSKGKTVHSQFRIPWNPTQLTCAIDSSRPVYKIIQKAPVLLWDQASFCSKYIFEEVDRFLRAMMNNMELFGGKIVVVCGDFHECLPIAKKTKTDSAEIQSILFSEMFKQMQQFTLNENYRFKLHSDYRFCLEIGTGIRNEIAIPNQCRVYNLNTLISTIYGNDNRNTPSDDLMNRSILTVGANDVDYLNRECMNRFYESSVVYQSINFFRKINPEQRSRFYVMDDIMQSLPKYFQPETLVLNINCPIILRQSYKGLAQGTRLIVKNLTTSSIIAEIGAGNRKGKLINIYRVNTIKLFPYGNVQFVRRQFPVSLAFALTINKAQGLEFRRVGVYFPCTVFAHGQMYVAFSRVPNIEEDMKIFVVEPNDGHYSFDHMPNVVNTSIAKHLLPINI